jgi:UDP-2,3-diacylglucosamine pyrophosphatase LpxH
MKCRAVWISDVHLGTKHAQVEPLIAFLRAVECRYLYIVGDLIDGWALRSKWHWRDDHNVLVQKLLRMSRKQTRVIYITGNHDEFMENYLGHKFGSVTLAREVIHVGADGKRYLVLHGHQVDGIAHIGRLLEHIGSHLYDRILDFNLYFNRLRRRFGFGYWSVAAYLKFKAKTAVAYISGFEATIAQLAHKQNADGVICGHIHRAEIKDIDGIRYLNCGDWVESCTALVEDFAGNITLVDFHENPVLRAGRGAGTHDAGDGGEGDRRGSGPRDRAGRRRSRAADQAPGLLCFGDAGARDGLPDTGVRVPPEPVGAPDTHDLWGAVVSG